jgi:hypothetical protein
MDQGNVNSWPSYRRRRQRGWLKDFKQFRGQWLLRAGVRNARLFGA